MFKNLHTTRRERAAAQKIIRAQDRAEQAEAKAIAAAERVEVRELLRAIARPIDSTEDYRYREEKLNRLWTLAFC